jgi:uncharacterized protein (TIGR02466 family)
LQEDKTPGRTELYSLFPVPVFKKFLKIDFTKDQIDVFKNSAQRPNATNTSSANNNILDLPCMKDFKDVLESHVQQYFTDIIKAPPETKPYITLSWINWTDQHQAHHAHAHQNSIVSGVFYFETNDEDKIYFYNPQLTVQLRISPTEFNTFNSPTWWVTADPMSLILFPSTLIHEVAKKQTPGIRISLSFNTFVRGSLGTEQDLNYVSLK